MKRLVGFLIVIFLFVIYQQIQIIELQKQVEENTVDIIWADDKAYKNKQALDLLIEDFEEYKVDFRQLKNSMADHYKWHSIWD